MENALNKYLRWASGIRMPATFRALRHRNFRLFYFGQMISLIGTWMQNVAQSWLVYLLTGSPFALGLVSFAGSLPVLLCSLPAGVVADRVGKRNLIVAMQTAAMIQAFMLSFLTWTGIVQIWHVALLAFGLGTISSFDMPARQAFVIEMVGKEDLMNAIALNSAIFNGARIVGPAIAGILVASLGVAPSFFLNGLSFLAVIAGLLLMDVQSRPVAHTGASMRQNIAEGLNYLRSNTTVRTLTTLVAVASIFGMPYAMLMPAFAADVLHVDASGLGFLSAAVGLGALAGAFALASLAGTRRKGLLLTAGNLLFPAMLLLFAASRSFLLSLAILVGVGWAFITQNATVNSLIQSIVPDYLRGRVMSVYTLMFVGMIPVGSLQAGVVAQRFGAPFAVGLGAAIALGYSLWVLWRHPEVRKLE